MIVFSDNDNPYQGLTLRQLLTIRHNLERIYNGPIPVWAETAWQWAYQEALHRRLNEEFGQITS